MTIHPLPLSERTDRFRRAASRYRSAVENVKGAVPAILLRETVVSSWGWILLRLSLDIGNANKAGELPEEKRIVESIGEEKDIVNLIERIGARIALPEAYLSSAWQPTPEVEFWTSHMTGEPLPNPFTTDNRDDQIFVERNLGEAFAEELKIAARGGRTYAEEMQRREEARLGDLVKDWPVDRPNPYEERPREYDRPAIEWDKWSAAERQRLEKENPPLARWLQKIARNFYPNPWDGGESWNRTKQMAVLKADPQFADLLERTGHFRTEQLTAESMEAERRAAEARRQAEEAARNAQAGRTARR